MESKRLYLRPCAKADFELLYTLFCNDDVTRYTIFDTCAEESDFRPFFDDVLINQANTGGHKTYGYPVYLREDGSFIGLGIIDVACKNEFGGCGEIGYLLLPQYWGRGYATEIADTLLKIGFSVLQLHRICARCNENNKASEKVMKKTGMQKEGELRKARFKHGGWHNELVYALLAEKYRPKQQ